MPDKCEILDSDDVIEFDKTGGNLQVFMIEITEALEISCLFRENDFTSSLMKLMNISDGARHILKEGISCRTMTTRKTGWARGKFKFALQFIPDEVENFQSEQESSIDFVSPLDEIRNSIS